MEEVQAIQALEPAQQTMAVQDQRQATSMAGDRSPRRQSILG